MPKFEIRSGMVASLRLEMGVYGLGFLQAAIISAVMLPAGPLEAQPAPGMAFVTRSQSGQFIVHANSPTAQFVPIFDTRGNTNLVRLDAARLTVASERIKKVLWRNLATVAPWRGKIHLFLHPANGSDETITITSEQFTDGWQYGVYLPDLVQRERFTRSLVQVLLLEMANRNAEAHGAEVPLWLTEGLTQQLLADEEAGLIPPQAQRGQGGKGFDRLDVARTSLDIRTNNPLAQAHRRLRNDQALTFDQLSWPTEDQLSGEAGAAYRGSAQLFVTELSHLKDGRRCLRAMVEGLPAHLNWQIAFFKAFQDFFQDSLGVEKWWALHLARFTDRDVTQAWPLAESLQRLEQALVSPIQVRTGPDELPMRSEASLQTVIREWENVRRTQTLKNKTEELDFLRLRVSREVSVIVEEYRQTLLKYLQNDFRTPPVFSHGERIGQGRVGKETLKRLDELDTRREALRRTLEPVATAKTEGTVVESP